MIWLIRHLKIIVLYLENNKEFQPDYEFPNSLASTLLETSHSQRFFSEHLNRLTDNPEKIHHNAYVLSYLNQLLFSVLK
jgi:hypothetical protein